MKKTFRLSKGKHAPERVIDSIKADIRKFVKRQRAKELPTDVDFWDFLCKVGLSEEVATEVHLTAISQAVDQAAAASTTDTIFVSIETSGKRRNPPLAKPKPEEEPAPSIFDVPPNTVDPAADTTSDSTGDTKVAEPETNNAIVEAGSDDTQNSEPIKGDSDTPPTSA